MITFLRRWFGRRYDPDPAFSEQESYYDAETQELIFSSFDLLDRITAAGWALDDPKAVTHIFLGPDRRVQSLASVLQSRGYTILEQTGGRLLVGQVVLLSHKWIEWTVPEMCLLAAEFELNYDGWDVEPGKGDNEQTNAQTH